MLFVVQYLVTLLVFVAVSSIQLAHAASKPQKKVVVLVTGCSSGIGKSTAIEFAKDTKFNVWATMRSMEKWDVDAKDNLKTATMDVTSEESIAAVVSRIIEEEGRIDVVVNNAGYGLAGALELVSIEEAKNLFEVNVWGVVRVLQAVLPHMRRKLTGHVINISSTSGIRGIPCMEYYTGSKFALEGLMDSMRYSLAPYNISVTNVNAGPVRTAFIDRYGDVEQGGRGTRAAEDEHGYLQGLTSRMVLGLQARIASADVGQSSEEVAHLIVKLAALKLATKRLTDVPFNIGSSLDSQHLLEEVRVNPTGWGGLHNEILQSLPPLVANRPPVVAREEL